MGLPDHPMPHLILGLFGGRRGGQKFEALEHNGLSGPEPEVPSESIDQRSINQEELIRRASLISGSCLNGALSGVL